MHSIMVIMKRASLLCLLPDRVSGKSSSTIKLLVCPKDCLHYTHRDYYNNVIQPSPVNLSESSQESHNSDAEQLPARTKNDNKSYRLFYSKYRFDKEDNHEDNQENTQGRMTKRMIRR